MSTKVVKEFAIGSTTNFILLTNLTLPPEYVSGGRQLCDWGLLPSKISPVFIVVGESDGAVQLELSFIRLE